MKKLVSLLLGSLFVVTAIQASPTTDIENLVTKKINSVVGLIQNKSLERTERNDRILGLVKPIFDFELMAKLSIGGKYWKKMNQTQRHDFTRHFTDRLQDSFLEKLDLYTNEVVEYGQARQVKRGRVQMPAYLVTKDDKIEMMFKFYRGRTEWRLYDLEILGVSVIQTYRSQFKNELKKGSIDALIAKLGTAGGFKIPQPEQKNK